MKHLAVFASGSGTNAENIINFFSDDKNIEISLILSNKKDAFVLKRAENLNVKSVYFSKDDFYKSQKVIDILHENQIDFIILAGFLWLIPKNIISEFDNKIVNIHPALLPKYGGKGMFGMNVHKAVIQNNEKQSGITIHYVNEKYDDGNIIFQAKCPVNTDDTPELLAEKIHQLEYKYYPQIIRKILSK